MRSRLPSDPLYGYDAWQPLDLIENRERVASLGNARGTQPCGVSNIHAPRNCDYEFFMLCMEAQPLRYGPSFGEKPEGVGCIQVLFDESAAPAGLKKKQNSSKL